MTAIMMLAQAASFGQQGGNPQVKKSNVIVGFEWIGSQSEYPPP
jgi:hypothetical protein